MAARPVPTSASAQPNALGPALRIFDIVGQQTSLCACVGWAVGVTLQSWTTYTCSRGGILVEVLSTAHVREACNYCHIQHQSQASTYIGGPIVH